MQLRAIPSTGESLPAIGLGTWQVFDVGGGARELAPLKAVLQRLFAAGGRVVDSSPMYGRAEAVTGTLLAEMNARRESFLATKVWIHGAAAGAEQKRETHQSNSHQNVRSK